VSAADSCHSGILDFARVEEPSSLHSEGSFEATWDWPQEAETERRHLEDMGQASCSSVELPEAAPEAFGSVEVCKFLYPESVLGKSCRHGLCLDSTAYGLMKRIDSS
jgi:hypothetical protein